MRLKATFRVPKVNQMRFQEALHACLSKAISESCRRWLTTVVKESTAVGLPIWSAASIATFSPLASQINFALAMAPVSGAPDRVSVGIASGTGVFKWGEPAGLYTFTYSTSLKHLIINEYHNANTFINPKTGKSYFHLKHPGPYHFQQKAEQAFRDFASTVVLPGWGSILDVATIVVG
jgi:hypothetical protein